VADLEQQTPPLLTRRQLREQEQQRVSVRTTPIVVEKPSVAVVRPAEKRSVVVAKPAEKPSWGRRVLSWGTVIATPLLFIGVSLPVNLFYPSSELSPAVATGLGLGASPTAAQSFTVASSGNNQLGVSRESWSVTSYAEVLRSRYGNRNFSYSTSGTGNLRWPFPVAVPISSGFGDRVAPCRYCSSNHRGVDFTPGNGSPIFAIADGVVTVSEFGRGYGQYVYIEHQINGNTITSVYAHMQRGSSPLRVGERIPVGEFIGLVGNTGISTGPHLHFEIRINNEYVDPFSWLKTNAS
jgi:murein DD-endopeptidase MepM/ murein hydrolase activator NlpD